MLVDTSDSRGTLFERLVEEHRDILAMLAATLEIDDTDMLGRRAGFARLARVLRIHARAEEAIVFPRLDGSYELGHHVREEQAQHRAIDGRMKEIERSSAIGDAWRAEVEALRRVLEQHFAVEEKFLIPHAHCVISDPDAHTLLADWDQECEFLGRQIA
jgi:hypothetical protein